MNTALAPEQRTALLIAAMTLDEKMEQLVGTPGRVQELPQCVGWRHTDGILRLHIPTFRITNGPVGIGQGDCTTPAPGGGPRATSGAYVAPATALPSALALAASFDRTLALSYGELMGTEAMHLGVHVVEGPGINLARAPQGGRNFEYFGEDPMLSGTMAVQEIIGMQRHGIIAMPKHYVGNDQETNRFTIDTVADDRTLHEMYLLPFEMAVKDGSAASILCSYNKINGTQMCENKHFLTDVLRGQWGFKGYVQSDFFAVHSAAPTLLAGMDHEMPGDALKQLATRPFLTPQNLRTALAAGQITESDIDTALARRYTQMFRMGIFDRPIALTPIDGDADGQIARTIGEQCAVLLKNISDTLPLDASAIRSIALIGQPNYASKAVSGCCGGSSQVRPIYTITPLQGLRNALRALGSAANVTLFTVATDNSNLAAAIDLASSADIAIVMAGALSDEGADRPNLSLPDNQDAMISAIAAANPHTVVILKDSAAVLMPWINQVPAVLEAWFPGQEDGNIVARLLFGLANPSGKLPITFPKGAGDVAADTPERFPGVTVRGAPVVVYSEGLKTGYRWYDAQRIEPLFPFGFGLSYTTFSISNLEITPKTSDGTEPIEVQFVVQNTGSRRGAEVPQIYVGLPASTGEPAKRLVAFEKVWLEPGEQKKVCLVIDPGANSHPLGYWDSDPQRWAIADGEYQVYLGNSASTHMLSGTVTLHAAKRQ
jgi:beta-glucosidase